MEVLGRLLKLKRIPSSMRVEIYVDENANLNFACPVFRTWAPCTGKWDGIVSVNLTLLRKFAKDMPKGDPLTFEVRNNYLHIGTLGLDCKHMS